MSWEDELKAERPYDNEMDSIIRSHTMLSDSWFKIFIEELEELKKLIESDAEAAKAKWHEMTSGREDIEGTFEAIMDEYKYIDRLLGDA